MNITFLQNDYIDSLIVNTADGTPLYQANTPFGLVHRTTSIRRVVPGVGVGDLVADIRWAPLLLRSSKITYRGVTIQMKDLLDRPHFFSSSRVFTGHDGRQYKWKSRSNKFEMFDVLTDTLLAESHRRKLGIIGPSRKLNVDISPQATHMVDDIIVTFIIVAEEKRKNDNAAAAGAAASSSSAAAAAAAG